MNNKEKYFNNLLSEENFSALKIQIKWKEFLLLREFKSKIKQEKSTRVKVYSTRIASNQSIHSNTFKIRNILDGYKINYDYIDLSENKLKRKEIPSEKFILPVIIIDNFYIGEIDDFNNIVDLKILEDILDKEYLKKCLYCSRIRKSLDDLNCYFCESNYMFFDKSIKNN